MKNRAVLLTSLIALLPVLVLLGCSLGRGGVSRITPTPTKTPRALFTSTLTPIASLLPSDTPLPSNTPVPPTDTPLPTDTPWPTDTTAPPSDTPAPLPTDTPVPPTDTPAPPTNTPKPAATNMPVPPTNAPEPQVDFKVKEIVAFEDGSLTKTGFHNIYFTVIDASGQPLDNLILEDENGQAHFQPVTGTKGPGRADFEMLYADYNFKVMADASGRAYSSEVTHRLSVVPGHSHWPDLIAAGICPDEASCRAMGSIHYSYNVTFQRTW